MSNVLTVAGLYSGGNTNVMYTTDSVTYNPASFTDGGNAIDLATEYPESTVLFIENNGSVWLMAIKKSPNVGGGLIARSTDGSNWTIITSSVEGGDALPYIAWNTPLSVAWNGNRWIIVNGGNPDTYVAYSADGNGWTLATNETYSNLSIVRGGSNIFVGAVGFSGVMDTTPHVFIQTSTDGSTWTPSASANNILNPIAASSDFSEIRIRDLRYNSNFGQWIAVFNAVDYESSVTSNFILVSEDPESSWAFSNINSLSLDTPNFIGWNSNLWVIGGTGSNKIATSDISIEWSNSPSMNSANAGGSILSVSWNGMYWIAAGVDSSSNSAFYYSADTVLWETITGITGTGSYILGSMLYSDSNSGPNPGSNPYTYEEALLAPVPSDSNDKANYFAALTNNYSNYSSSTAVSVSNSNLVNYYITLVPSIPVDSALLFLPASNGVVEDSVIASLYQGDYVLFPDNYTITIASNTYTISNNNLIITADGVPTTIVPDGSFTVNGKIFQFLTAASPGLTLVTGSNEGSNPGSNPYTYESALLAPVPSDSNDKVFYFAAITNNFSNYSSSTAVTLSSSNSSNLVNYYISQGGPIPVNTALRFLPTNSSRVVSQSVITSLSNGDYVLFPDNYSVTISGKNYATSNNNLIITASGVPSTVAPGEAFTVYNKTLTFLTAGSPAVTVVTATAANPYTYEEALLAPVPSDSNDKAFYFAAITNNFSNYSSSTAVTVTNSNLANYYINQGATISVDSPIRFLPASNGVVEDSVIASLSEGDYVLFPDNYTITIASNTYAISNNNLIITADGVPTTIEPDGSFTVSGKILQFLTAASPGLTLVTGSNSYTYESALLAPVPSDPVDKAFYFAAITNNFSNYSSSTAVTLSSSNSSNLVNYYRSLAPSIPVGTALRFLPTNSSRVVSQSVITSLAVGDYVMFPDNYTLIISGKTYAISSNSITITASGVPATLAPGGEFIIYNKTLEFITAGSTGVTVVTATASNPPCFLEGTKILCLVNEEEQYITIESLTKGTLVKTVVGYKPVTHLGYSKMTNSGLDTRERNQLYVCTPEKYPTLTEPLYITGCHSILVDEITDYQREETMKVYGRVFITNKKYRLEAYLDERASPWPEKTECTVWHVCLEHQKETFNYGIYANGLLVESISENMITTSKTLTLV